MAQYTGTLFPISGPTAADEKRQRRRMQNTLNQRARTHSTHVGQDTTKDILESLTVSIIPGIENDEVFPGHLLFPSLSVLFATAPGLPESLAPTSLQMDVVHATWINLIPFPQMRDNLIAWDTCYDHPEFVRDLLGDTIDENILAAPWSTRKLIASKLVLSEGNNDEVAASRKGLILWGEPHRVESWEATPGFIRKWPWVVEGCEELIESSNRWRMMRGEEPMRISVYD
ncbi:hypothetical protein BDV28DRAFT_146971 [Aspergillus coremiiformis]|uniref:BZIP domain-containing protein n=1 Tax=Aspergillus coremiiformis TaxID=138285 RepID=A0A5N6ZBQ8_9EURO|nr:hypothetical protein BDV28DRAFT_146971 [Aspergillus coremiiformis]